MSSTARGHSLEQRRRIQASVKKALAKKKALEEKDTMKNEGS